mgnify:CR=1 FL=1
MYCRDAMKLVEISVYEWGFANSNTIDFTLAHSISYDLICLLKLLFVLYGTCRD